MAMVSLLAASLLIVQTDTVRLTSAEFLDQALAAAPGVELAELQADAARSRADQTRAWANPQLSLQVDNYGAEREVTNIDGLAGLEAQAVFAFPLSVGGDRGARMRLGAAGARGAEASLQLTRGDASVRAVAALASVRRDEAAFERAQDEVETLTRLADALERQAELGRAPAGDAARARLALAIALEALALQQSELARSRAELSLVAGYDPFQAVEVVAGRCTTAALASEGDVSPVGDVPEVALAQAEEDLAQASLDLARAQRIPDLVPELGVRRTMGTEALYAGLSFNLPLFDRQGRSVDAARAEALGAAASARDRTRAWQAEVLTATATLRALSDAGRHFTSPEWGADLDATVTAVETRWELGEGTLVELLDGRRARFEALAARDRWAAAWLIARARLARLRGSAPDASLFCDPFGSSAS
jgi:cobalt-zinc-cadmium efflux system outer membrane protein